MVNKTTPGGSDVENDIDDDVSASMSADAILRDFRYKLQCSYMEPGRDLRVGVHTKLRKHVGINGFN